MKTDHHAIWRLVRILCSFGLLIAFVAFSILGAKLGAYWMIAVGLLGAAVAIALILVMIQTDAVVFGYKHRAQGTHRNLMRNDR